MAWAAGGNWLELGLACRGLGCGWLLVGDGGVGYRFAVQLGGGFLKKLPYLLRPAGGFVVPNVQLGVERQDFLDSVDHSAALVSVGGVAVQLPDGAETDRVFAVEGNGEAVADPGSGALGPFLVGEAAGLFDAAGQVVEFLRSVLLELLLGVGRGGLLWFVSQL